MYFKVLGAAVLLGGLVQSSFGATITNGHFDISGTIYVTNFQIGAVVTPGGTCPNIGVAHACIFWTDPTRLNPNRADITASGLPNGDIPLALAGNLAANIFSLTNPPNIVDGAGFPAQLFMSFNNAGITTLLNITYIDPGTNSPALCGGSVASARSGDVCTPPGSLFNFVNTPPPSSGNLCNGGCGSTATWVFEGVTGGPGQGGQTWVGNFTSQFPQGMPFQQVFADLAANGFVSNTYSATITLIPNAVVPEPGSLVLMIGSGLIGLSAFLRRRIAK